MGRKENSGALSLKCLRYIWNLLAVKSHECGRERWLSLGGDFWQWLENGKGGIISIAYLGSICGFSSQDSCERRMAPRWHRRCSYR
ncbi:hypothetical protein FIBSPDRAFT_31063 [Athelia psychrophila]|uniref:Uncharacterized protein n=1 Tax=Athelia psychrophila TaxID=1759441 RepID=A0A167T2I7_9AGAM|nr:hypothetical protein FIBSPDRAFT_31063 [Fibularhizoctonia sp. CBS 109695]